MMKGAPNTQLCPVAVGSEHSPNAKGFFVCGFWFGFFFCGHHVDMIVFLNVLVNAQANRSVRRKKKGGGGGRRARGYHLCLLTCWCAELQFLLCMR